MSALSTGQWIKIYLEPFDPVDFIYCQLDNVDLAGCAAEKQMRTALQQAGVENALLAQAAQDEILETFTVFKALLQGSIVRSTRS